MCKDTNEFLPVTLYCLLVNDQFGNGNEFPHSAFWFIIITI